MRGSYTSSNKIQRPVSLDDLKHAVAGLEPTPSLFDGLKIVVNHQRTPKRTLAKDVPVSPEFRIEVDKWMLEFFGYTPLIPDGVMYAIAGQGHVCNPKTFAMIKDLTCN